jgi:fructosamine-3-kinase
MSQPERARRLVEIVEERVGGVCAVATVSGGDVAESFRLQLADGGAVFAKTHHDPPPEFFETEAAGLEWLRAARAVPVPEVLAVVPGVLVLQWIDEGSGRPDEDGFGRALAALHSAGASCFGREDRRTTGSRRLPNEPRQDWADFYAENRLRPLAGLARQAEALPDEVIDRLEALAGRLGDLGVPVEPPARLHGDLWAGNRLVDERGVSWLIDPAAHGGHREFDLAMMQLFGGFGPACVDAYDDAFPLGSGWRARIPLHQLAPLAVHAIKFGGGYAAATERALRAAEHLG